MYVLLCVLHLCVIKDDDDDDDYTFQQESCIQGSSLGPAAVQRRSLLTTIPTVHHTHGDNSVFRFRSLADDIST